MANEEFDFNIFIKEVAAEMVKNPCEENFLHIVAELIMRVNDAGTVPMVKMNELHIALSLDPDIEAEEVFAEDGNIGNRLVFVVTDDGHKWIPLFTGKEEIQGVPDTNEVMDMSIEELLERACEEEEMDGIIINPFSDSVALHKEAIELILDNATGEFKHAC